jgi:hypothetical protein
LFNLRQLFRKVRIFPYEQKSKNVDELNLTTLNRIKNKLTNPDEKLNIIFLVNEKSKWSSQSLYNEFKKESRINVNIAVCEPPYKIFNKRTKTDCFLKDYDFFKNIDKEAIKLYDEKANKSLSLEGLNADIIFYQQPWGVGRYASKIIGKALNAYFPYSFLLTDNNRMHYNLYSFHPFLWKYFTQSEEHKNLYLSFDKQAEEKLVVSGYSKLDTYFDNEIIDDTNLWKITKKENTYIKRVIYAPHHSFNKVSLGLSTFDWNNKYFLTLAKENKDIQWIYKPHPALKHCCIKYKLMSEKEYDDYVTQWNSLANAKVYDSGNYFDIFKTSDALITDCASFLAEYLPTKKPIIFIDSKKSIGFNPIGEKIIKNYYKASSIEELNDLIKKVIIQGDDYLYEKRMQSLKYVLPNKEKSAIFIKDHLKEIFGLNNGAQ